LRLRRFLLRGLGLLRLGHDRRLGTEIRRRRYDFAHDLRLVFETDQTALAEWLRHGD
jgi:hypothetical protein